MSNNNFFKSGFGSSFGSWSQFYKKNKTTITDSNGEVSVEAVEQIADQLNEQESILTNKVNQVQGKELSENDFTDADKSKLDGVEESANNYVHPTTHGINEVSGLSTALDSKVAKESGMGLSENDLTDDLMERLENGVTDNLDITTLQPKDAKISYNGIKEGAIKITLPQGYTATMMKLEVDIFDYLSHESIKILISGYNYSTNQIWKNTSVQILANKEHLNYPVRFGYDGGKCCIYIGELTSTWSYPKVVVSKGIFGYANFSYHQWISGWRIGIDNTGFQSISKTHTDNLLQNITDSEVAKLSGIESGANKYIHPSTHGMSEVSGLNSALNSKVDKVAGKGLSENDFTDTDKSKLDGIETGANNYVHPSLHSIEDISELQTELDRKIDKP